MDLRYSRLNALARDDRVGSIWWVDSVLVTSYGHPFRRSSIHWAVIATLAVILPGCATRPGPEVLTPVAIAPGVKTLQVYVATTRERQSPSENVFTANRANALNFAKFVISVPPNHKPGEIEMPTNPSDPQTSFAVLDQAVMSEADFHKAVAPQRAERRKKQKVFVFVHGFNNNFQESLFRLAQLQADAKIDGMPILFSWPSQAQVAAYATDQDAASYSRDYLMTLLTMLTRSPEVGDILVVGHSMGAMLTADALQQLRAEGKNQVIARLGRVVLAAPDINAQTFRAQVQAIGPLKPPLLVLVSKDDGALQISSFLSGGGVPRTGALDVNNPVVQEAALKAKVQVVDISQLESRDGMKHDQFVSVAVLYSRMQQTMPNRSSAGTFVLNGDSATLQPVASGRQALAQ
jgi:esterase/lipase superfamily enzyme